MKGQTVFDAVFAYGCREAVAAPRPLFCFRVRDPDKLDCAITIRCLPRQSHVLVSTVQPDPMLVWWFVRNSRHPEGLRPDAAADDPTAQRGSSGTTWEIRPPEGSGVAIVPVLLISVGSRHLGAFGPEEGADGPTAQQGDSERGAAPGQPGRQSGNALVRAARIARHGL